MAFFRRRSSPADPPADPSVAEFWDWWSQEGRRSAGGSINGTLDPQEFARAMGGWVGSLGELGWELAAGETSEHVLVITAEGSPEKRALARRVVLAAPDADETWSYVDARPPAPDPESVVLSAGGAQDLDLARVQVAARLNSGRFDIQVHHPAFADLPDDARAKITSLALDAALGELDKELWLGDVQGVAFAPLDGFGLTALRSVVHDLKRKHLDEDGRPRWTMLRGETPDGPLVAMARSPLHPLTAPHLETYVAVSLPYSDRDDGGLPGPESADALRWFEERLVGELGTHGELVAHLSTAGTRTLHLYVDSTAGLLPTLEELARSWHEGRATVHEMRDPGWDAVQHLKT